MLKMNKDRLVMVAVQGEVSHSGMRTQYRTGFDGVARVSPATGGITYNVRVGDSAMGWQGDHVEPSVSTKNMNEVSNAAYNTLSCVGNEATIVSGDAKGSKGVVTGKHGGIEHVLVDFPPEVMEKMTIGDKILVRSFGQGLQLTDFPTVKVMNLDPGMLEKMGIKVVDGKLHVPVAHIAPAVAMGSGLGSSSAFSGDYDITTMDKETLAEYGLTDMRLGDIVAIKDASSMFGRHLKKGAVIIGIIVHSDSYVAGHGPGVTSLMNADCGEIVPVLDKHANIAEILKLR